MWYGAATSFWLIHQLLVAVVVSGITMPCFRTVSGPAVDIPVTAEPAVTVIITTEPEVTVTVVHGAVKTVQVASVCREHRAPLFSPGN